MALKMTYNEIYDINTNPDGPSIIALHTPTSNNLYRLMKPQFDSYKKFKYVKADVTIVNGMKIQNPSTAYTTEAGNLTADPRDLLDPIMFRGCHGEDLGHILNQIYSNSGNIFTNSSADKKAINQYLTAYYYTCLSDNSWKKGNTSSTLRIPNLHPLIYQVASNAPLNNSFQSGNAYNNDTDTGASSAAAATNMNEGNAIQSTSGLVMNDATGYVTDPSAITDSALGRVYAVARQIFTDKLRPLGWMDTKQPFANVSTASTSLQTSEITRIPKIFMGLLFVPKAWKSYTFLRLIIRHTILFSGLRTFSEGASSAIPTELFLGNGDAIEANPDGLYHFEMDNLDDGGDGA